MAVTLPQVVVSRDGQRAVVLDKWLDGPFFEPAPDGSSFEAVVRLKPRGKAFATQFKVSSTLRVMWNIEGQTQKWDEAFETARQDLALIAIAQYLDENAVPEAPTDDHYALQPLLSSYLSDIYTQDPPTDQELREYVEAKLYWAWKFRLQPARFEMWEARRLRVSIDELEHAAFTGIGSWWARDSGG